jgi:hypothetical protein
LTGRKSEPIHETPPEGKDISTDSMLLISFISLYEAENNASYNHPCISRLHVHHRCSKDLHKVITIYPKHGKTNMTNEQRSHLKSLPPGCATSFKARENRSLLRKRRER